jgi:hypothetical protein
MEASCDLSGSRCEVSMTYLEATSLFILLEWSLMWITSLSILFMYLGVVERMVM